MLWQLLLLVVFVSAAVLRWWQKRLLARCKIAEALGLNLPFVGHAVQFIGNGEVRMKTLLKLNRSAFERDVNIIGLWMGTELFLTTANPEVAEFILKTCLHKGGPMIYLKMITGNGSIFADVPIWRPRRKMVAPLFSPKNLSLFVEVFASLSEKLAQKLQNAIPGPSPLGPYFQHYAFDAVCNTTLGVDIDVQNNPDHPFLNAFSEVQKLMSARILSPWLYNDTVYKFWPDYPKVMGHKKTMYDFINKIILDKLEKERRTKWDPHSVENNNKILALSELLIRSNEDEALTLTGQAEEVLMMVMAGTDTSALTICYVLHMLSQRMDIQDKVYRELMEVFGDSNKRVTAEDLPRLHYLENVIKETLRLFPPVPMITRTPESDITLPCGKIIPKGATVVISLIGVNRNPKYWGADAEQFRPERFLEPFKHPKQYMPFSDGPRNCVGYKYAILSMKTALSVVLRRYKVFPANSSTVSTKDNANPLQPQSATHSIRLEYKLVIKDVEDVVLRLESRC